MKSTDAQPKCSKCGRRLISSAQLCPRCQNRGEMKEEFPVYTRHNENQSLGMSDFILHLPFPVIVVLFFSFITLFIGMFILIVILSLAAL